MMEEQPIPAGRRSLHFLQGGGAVGEEIRRFDWAATPLGPPEFWPGPLKTLVGVMLATEQPMFVAWGPERLLIYNESYAPILGRKRWGALGRPFFTVWNEAMPFVGPLMESASNGVAVNLTNFVLPLDRHDGPRDAHFDFGYIPVYDEQGAVLGIFCPCRELTEQVETERKLQRERRRQQALLQQMPGFVAVLEGPEHVFEYVNDAYRAISGPRDFIGRTVREVFPELGGQGFYELMDEAYATGRPFAARSRPLRLTGEDHDRFIDMLYEPIRDEAGAVSGIFVGGYDVTEHVQTAAALKTLNETLESRITERTARLLTREALIRTFYEHSSECHAVLVEEGEGFRYEEINPATLRLYGKSREQVIGLTAEQVLGAAAAVQLNEHLRAGLRAGAPIRYERQQGEAMLEAVATPVPDQPGAARRIVVSARDVTERRALEERLHQSQKMEAVGQLTGGLAHDFNNLLTGITGSLEMLQVRVAQGRLGELDRYVLAAQGAAKRAAALTHRLLAFSRRQTLDAKPTDVNRLMSDLAELIRRTMGPAITAEFIEASGLWPTIVDPNQLENALLNLCINARDAMPDGGRLTVETGNKWLDERAARERDLAPGQYVTLCVSDNGSGMTPETAARAFDPFFTTKPLGEGTGLGLSMVYGFVRQSGGHARIYSEVGSGTLVCLYLPRHYGEREAAPAPEETGEGLRAEHGETVLVVDDEPTIRMLVAEVLSELGYVPLEAEDGKAGLKILQSPRRIDLLITDVGLPGGMNGRQLADAGLVLRPELKVLFITGYAENAVIGDGHLQRGMHVVTKPFALDMLAARIKAIIG